MNNCVNLTTAASILGIKKTKLWRQIAQGHVRSQVINKQHCFELGYLYRIRSRGYFDLEY